MSRQNHKLTTYSAAGGTSYYIKCLCGHVAARNVQLVDALAWETHGVCTAESGHFDEDDQKPPRTTMQEAFDRAKEIP